ncbi:MAG: nucleotidyltransferase [Clostridiales bacterium]|nr:nucleotidyltransferase [Candidatus Coliplasma equi]
MTAIILAAGLGSRYGGLKQIDPVGHHGEVIIAYSVYDCVRAGFDKVVFIIKEQHLEEFEETIGSRVKGSINVEYAFQNDEDLPDGFAHPTDRTKPWGTAHALRACRNIVHDKFVIFNADDFYGLETFRNMYKGLSEVDAEHCIMPGYTLANTLSENGHVARGVCITENGYVQSIKEIKKIMRIDGKTKYEEDDEWKDIDENAPVSMNFWGFTPDIFPLIEEGFADFLHNPDTDLLKGEYYIPNVVDLGIRKGVLNCKVLETNAKWMGVTYQSDKPEFQKFLNAKIDAGEYPENLWGI